MLENNGRGERIRTSDLTVPNRALYQAEPRPDTVASFRRWCLENYFVEKEQVG